MFSLYENSKLINRMNNNIIFIKFFNMYHTRRSSCTKLFCLEGCPSFLLDLMRSSFTKYEALLVRPKALSSRRLEMTIAYTALDKANNQLMCRWRTPLRDFRLRQEIGSENVASQNMRQFQCFMAEINNFVYCRLSRRGSIMTCTSSFRY